VTREGGAQVQEGVYLGVCNRRMLVYHRRSVQERDAAAARRLANLEMKELRM
jgi:hypothetical protein